MLGQERYRPVDASQRPLSSKASTVSTVFGVIPFSPTFVYSSRASRNIGERALISLVIVIALAATAHAEQFSLKDFPAPLVKKVTEIQKACGSQIVSAYRPGAVTPYGNASEHAFKRAVDLSGNPDCIYEHLQGWEGGASIDYKVVGHVHISWHPGGTEQGARFAHAGGGLMGALYRFWAGVLKIFD
jgi:hypothetical protein